MRWRRDGSCVARPIEREHITTFSRWCASVHDQEFERTLVLQILRNSFRRGSMHIFQTRFAKKNDMVHYHPPAPKFHEKTPRESTKCNFRREEEKQREILDFWTPPFGAPLLQAFPPFASLSSLLFRGLAPTLLGPPPFGDHHHLALSCVFSGRRPLKNQSLPAFDLPKCLYCFSCCLLLLLLLLFVFVLCCCFRSLLLLLLLLIL